MANKTPTKVVRIELDKVVQVMQDEYPNLVDDWGQWLTERLLPERVEKNRKARRKNNQDYFSRTAYAPNHMQRWTEYELDLVARHEMSNNELSKIIGRSNRAINQQRVRMKKAGRLNVGTDGSSKSE